MTDLLTHVLVAYVLLTVAGWRVEAVDARWRAVGMGGAAIPDLGKVSLLVDGRTVEGLLGVPFSYGPLSTLTGVVLVSGVIAVAFGRRYRRRAFTFLLVGGVASLLGDALRLTVNGRAGPLLYPLSWWRPPAPGLYVSSDPRVLAFVLVAAVATYAVDRRLDRTGETEPTA
ncbi:hypothetical protein BRC64_00750 [Halobacteriales archaeon QH_10_67_22]|nr:MAG: hypothetical protein BRC64_00750 [Halobacteriales archaeon QH_10_67_22]